jgi:hypothetical protein
VRVADDVARLEPLGMEAVRMKLERDQLSVPLLPALDEITPGDLVLTRMNGSDEDLAAELAAWVDSRGTELAARELLAFAAAEGAAARTAAITIVAQLGDATEPAWREALNRIELRCYAKQQLARLAGRGPEDTDLPAELQPESADFAWLITDTFGPFSHSDLGKGSFPLDLAELDRIIGLARPDELFEAMARLDHPDAEAVLTMFGEHASDKKTAKAARRAAYKASTRRASRQGGH